MTLKDICSVATKKANYLVSFIRDGWLRQVQITAETPGQLMLRWQEYTEREKVDINSVTCIELATI